MVWYDNKANKTIIPRYLLGCELEDRRSLPPGTFLLPYVVPERGPVQHRGSGVSMEWVSFNIQSASKLAQHSSRNSS